MTPDLVPRIEALKIQKPNICLNVRVMNHHVRIKLKANFGTRDSFYVVENIG